MRHRTSLIIVIFRNILYWLLLSVATVVVFLLLLLLLPLPRRWRHRVGILWPYFILWILKEVIGLKYQIIGRENIPDYPSVICSKHQSGWETIALQTIFPMQVYIAKRSLFFIPFFGWGLWIMNTIGIDRSHPRGALKQILTQGRERIEKGFWIAIFPEGTRIKPGRGGNYKHGAAIIAKELHVPLVPVAHNAGEFWPKGSILKYPGEVTVVIGQPISSDTTLSANEVIKQTETWIEKQQREIGGVGPFADPKERQEYLKRVYGLQSEHAKES